MINVGLTGNVAAGKSAVVDLLKSWGVAVLSADAIVRELQAPGTEVYDAIVARFGTDVVGRGGELDRRTLRRRVFSDPDALASLNAIVHPAVKRRREDLMAQLEAAGTAVVVNEIPLLFEVMDPDDFDFVILVDAPPAIRRERIIRDRGVEPEVADQMIAAQTPSAAKRERSNFVIENDSDRKILEERTRAVSAEISRLVDGA